MHVEEESARLIPPRPVFQTESERTVWTVMAESLEPGEVLFHGLRFSDPKEGDVEVDLLLLSPKRGAAIIEVKGGQVEFRDGEWTLRSNGGATRRIRPVDQARRAKHALRRYLDRCPEWNYGLLRSQWFLALPLTDVVGDMGPEAPRDRVIGRDDVPRMRRVIDAGLRDAPREPSVPPEPWVGLAAKLILNAPDVSHSTERYEEAHAASGHSGTSAVALIALAVAVIAGSFLAILVAGAWGIGVAAAVIGLALLVGYRLTRRNSRIPLSVALGAVIASVFVGGVAGNAVRGSQETQPQMALSPLAWEAVQSRGIDVDSLTCLTAYSPCVLDMPWDRNCMDIGFSVRVVTADDPYQLDRDGDGQGCTSYPESEIGEGVQADASQ